MEFIRDTEVARRLDIARSTLWSWVRIGHFPEGIKVGPRARRWRVDVVDAWIASRSADA